ncbi:MAG: hypothetical protein ACE5DW_02535 [Thermodesulfobacteriota bacterium]
MPTVERLLVYILPTRGNIAPIERQGVRVDLAVELALFGVADRAGLLGNDDDDGVGLFGEAEGGAVARAQGL